MTSDDIFNRLKDFYQSELSATLWLNTEHVLLNNEKPIKVIDRGEADKVIAIIEQLEAGGYT